MKRDEERERGESFENFENCNPKQTQAQIFFCFLFSHKFLIHSSKINKKRDIHLLRVVEERESKKRDDGGWRRRRRDDGTNANAALFEYSSSSFSLDDDDKSRERTTKTETGYKIHGLGEFQVLRGGTTRRSVP